MSVCLPVWLSGCLYDDDVRMMHDVRRTNFRDDLDLDELTNDLPSDFLDSCINYANSVVE